MIKEIDNTKVKNRLIALKLEHKLNNDDIAHRANVAPGTVNDHFNKNKPAKDIKSDILYKYSKLFGVSVDYLLTGENFCLAEDDKAEEKNITVEKIFDAVKVLMNAYGVNSFREECAAFDGFEVWFSELVVHDQLYMRFVEELKAVVKVRHILEPLGVYEKAVDEIIERVWPGQSLYFNGDKIIALYDDFSSVDNLEDEIDF